MAEVHYTLDARLDILDIVEGLSSGSATYAVDFLGRIDVAAERLAEFPNLGRVVPEYGQEDIREVIVESYRLVYRTRRDEVEIIGLAHGRRDLTSFLGDRPWRPV